MSESEDLVRPKLPPVTRLFEAQVLRAPGAAAVAAGDAVLSYAALNARANRFARSLVESGVGAEDRVAVLLPPSVDLIVALLAVLKAGGAYVPIDARHPELRVASILAEAAPRLVIATSDRAHRLGTQVLCFDAWDGAASSGLDLANRIHPDHPAYVIFTSGSTGRPKGVVVTHRSLGAYLSRARETYPGLAGESLLHSSIAFDLTNIALYGPLVSGGCVRIGALEDSASQPTFLKVTPSHIELLSALPDVASPSACLVVGGEALSSDMLARWRVRHPRVPVYNSYGPTETTVAACDFCLAPGQETAPGAVPIGRPFTYARAYVLNDRLARVPQGATGALYIAGEGLARGYLNQPVRTAERFVADPFGPPGARMYRTGDCVRCLPDGELEFLGRADEQIKLRGFRIEPGEIESVLAQHQGVGRAAVVAQTFDSGDVRLVAYVAPNPAHRFDPAELRAFAAQRLPEYMLPSAFVMIDRLPLTASGKLDRRALPLPDLGGGAGRAPESERQRALAALFAELLAVAPVGLDDSFFELGGHSLLAVRLLGRVRAAFGAVLTVRDLFESPTVAALSARLDTAHITSAPALRPRARPERVPLSFAQRGLWFLNRVEGPSPTYNVPLVLRLRGELDHAALRAAIDDLVERHASLRTIFPEIDGEPVQQLSELRPRFALERVPESELGERMKKAVRTAFDLAAEVPLRAWSFEVGHEHVLLLLLHHIAVDGWSLATLAADLGAAYASRRAGQAPAWPRFSLQVLGLCARASGVGERCDRVRTAPLLGQSLVGCPGRAGAAL